ncbi:MAG: AraC family transcriptional regulator, partial [Bacteroidota bacterium]
MDSIVHIKSINQLHKLAKIGSSKHPLYSIYRFEDLTSKEITIPLKYTYGFYQIGLKKDLEGYIKYGRKQYDFQEGVLGFSAPLQIIEVSPDIISKASGFTLMFHKEYIAGSSLEAKFDEYSFFSYAVAEGLHLSLEEEQNIIKIFENIETEYNLPIDQHSKEVVIANLELLLTYAKRYYKRQFVIRNDAKPDILKSFEKELKIYYYGKEDVALPSVEYFADKLHLSSNYLSDLLKATTGKTTLEHIHFQ